MAKITVDFEVMEKMETELWEAVAICECVEDITRDHGQIALAVALKKLRNLHQTIQSVMTMS